MFSLPTLTEQITIASFVRRQHCQFSFLLPLSCNAREDEPQRCWKMYRRIPPYKLHAPLARFIYVYNTKWLKRFRFTARAVYISKRVCNVESSVHAARTISRGERVRTGLGGINTHRARGEALLTGAWDDARLKSQIGNDSERFYAFNIFLIDLLPTYIHNAHTTLNIYSIR